MRLSLVKEAKKRTKGQSKTHDKKVELLLGMASFSVMQKVPFFGLEIPLPKGDWRPFFPFLPSADLFEFVVFHGCECDECEFKCVWKKGILSNKSSFISEWVFVACVLSVENT